jgi:hypothetical protein
MLMILYIFQIKNIEVQREIFYVWYILSLVLELYGNIYLENNLQNTLSCHVLESEFFNPSMKLKLKLTKKNKIFILIRVKVSWSY